MALDTEKIQKPIRKLGKLLRKNPKQPTPDQIHDLRTNTRRLEATLSALSLDSQRKGKRLLKDLARVRRRAGKIRDMDVLTSFASTVHPDGEQDCSVQLLEYLGARRRKHAKKLNATIGKSGTAMRNHLKQISRNLERELGNNSQGDKAASGQATASALTIQSQLMNPARLGRNNLHPYRLKVKEMRNILKLAANPGDQEFADWLGKVKDAIGEWHDWGELQAIARDVLEHGSACKLLREIKRIGDEKYEEALRETENMRAKFLSSRKKKHPGQPADEVWEATRALAA